MNINTIYHGNAVDLMKNMDVLVDLTVTSPPYDNLREYNGYEFDYKAVIDGLFNITAPGGVVVWVVGDAVINNSESGSSFRQALYFQEIGFNIHDTMIYEKNSPAFPAKRTGNRYSQIFEYMFIFSKGVPKTANLLCDKINKWAGVSSFDGKVPPVPNTSPRNNIWKYTTSFNKKTGHPAVFPEKLAKDNILTWSNEGDLVFDPMCGSGTTPFMAKETFRNYIGFDISEEYCKNARDRINKLKMVDKNVIDILEVVRG